MSIHPEDAAAYATEQHEDLHRILVALERIADALELMRDGDALRVRQAGAWITREDRP
jgi:hypothetical protein